MKISKASVTGVGGGCQVPGKKIPSVIQTRLTLVLDFRMPGNSHTDLFARMRRSDTSEAENPSPTPTELWKRPLRQPRTHAGGLRERLIDLKRVSDAIPLVVHSSATRQTAARRTDPPQSDNGHESS